MVNFKFEVVTNVCALGTAAILGVLTRTSVNLLFGPNRAGILSVDDVLFVDLGANVLGCFVLGLHVVLKEQVEIPGALSLAVATGYAGSVTTFASWNFQIVQMLAHRMWLESVGGLFVGVCLSFCAFVVGRDVGTLLLHVARRKPRQATPISDGQDKRASAGGAREDGGGEAVRRTQVLTALCLLGVFLSLESLMILGAVFDKDNMIRRSFWASAMCAPVGATLRWRLSFLNRRVPGFPLGTFIANMGAMFYDAVVGAAIIAWTDPSVEAILFLTATITGLGGSLSTVSTWVAEAFTMTASHRYVYVMASLVCAQLLGIVIYGTTFWVAG